jgi:hypothetical protein
MNYIRYNLRVISLMEHKLNVRFLAHNLIPVPEIIDPVFAKTSQNACFLLKVHKIENFFGFDFEICTFS